MRSSTSSGRSGRSTSSAERGSKGTSSGGGTRPPVNLWPRRIITGLGLLLIVALLVWGIVALVRAVIAAVSPEPTSQSSAQSAQSDTVDSSGYTLARGQQATADGLLTDGTVIEIPACLDRDVTVSVAASEAASGSPMPVSVTLQNKGSVACSTSLSNYALLVSSGGHQVYDSARCTQDESSAMTLLVRPGGSWTGSLVWDGHVYVDGCTEPAGGASVASTGTYKVTVTRAGREVSSDVADVTSPPRPQSGAQSGAQSGETTAAQSGETTAAQSGVR